MFSGMGSVRAWVGGVRCDLRREEGSAGKGFATDAFGSANLHSFYSTTSTSTATSVLYYFHYCCRHVISLVKTALVLCLRLETVRVRFCLGLWL